MNSPCMCAQIMSFCDAGLQKQIFCCSQVSAVAGASDDIRRATELAYRAVSEFGLSSVVGPLAVSSMGGGDDGALMLRDSGESQIQNLTHLLKSCLLKRHILQSHWRMCSICAFHVRPLIQHIHNPYGQLYLYMCTCL